MQEKNSPLGDTGLILNQLCGQRKGLGLQNHHQVFPMIAKLITPANGAGHDYPIAWHPIEMIALRHFKVCFL